MPGLEKVIKALIPAPLKAALKARKETLLIRSLRAAAAEQGLSELASRMEFLNRDIARQYTSVDLDTEYLRCKVIFQHAFQVQLAGAALPAEPCSVVDIGDSSGAHTLYLKALYPGSRADYLSINLDGRAVEKIKAKGLRALQVRAEEVQERGINADVFLLFETLEHLPDPFNFLHDLSARTRCRRLVLTVPYVRVSRLGLHHIREGLKEPISAERVHLLELCPEDLRLLFAHAGWRVETERIYRQYPKSFPLRATRGLWARWDFEGFYGAVLSRDESWSSLYRDWP